jgi:hypothetical protein
MYGQWNDLKLSHGADSYWDVTYEGPVFCSGSWKELLKWVTIGRFSSIEIYIYFWVTGRIIDIWLIQVDLLNGVTFNPWHQGGFFTNSTVFKLYQGFVVNVIPSGLGWVLEFSTNKLSKLFFWTWKCITHVLY